MSSFGIPMRFPVHSDKIIEYFEKKLKNDEYKIDAAKDKKILLVCFTNRCGSNNVCEDISLSADCAAIGENLNHDAVINNSKKYNFKSFVSYLEWILSAPNKIVGVKCSIDQLLFLKDIGFIESNSNIEYVFIRRRDVLSQAVSLLIANKNQQWTSYQNSSQTGDVEISDIEISQTIDSINMSNAYFYKYFSSLGVQYSEIIYEEYIANKLEYLNKMLVSLDQPKIYSLDFVKNKKTLKQKDVMKEKIIGNYRAMFTGAEL